MKDNKLNHYWILYENISSCFYATSIESKPSNLFEHIKRARTFRSHRAPATNDTVQETSA